MITPVSRAVAVNPDPAIELKAGIGLFTNAVAGDPKPTRFNCIQGLRASRIGTLKGYNS